MSVVAFAMHDDERRRLIGGKGEADRRRGGRRRGDPMDAFTWAVIGMMGAVTLVYCVLMLRTRPGTETPSGAIQGLLAVVPLATAMIALRRKNDDDDDR